MNFRTHQKIITFGALMKESLYNKISKAAESINDQHNMDLATKLLSCNVGNTTVISAFPGTGKTHLFKTSPYKILDSDSSKFPKDKFPANYIEYIKSNIGEVDIILVSSHKEVRDALVENSIGFVLVYPDIELKEDYLERYKERGSPEGFIKLIDKNWDQWIEEVEHQTGCVRFKLKKGQYLSDVIKLSN